VPDVVDDEFVCSSFDLVTKYLKTRASYIWWKAKHQRAVNDYSIGTWNMYVQRSSIEKWAQLEMSATFRQHFVPTLPIVIIWETFGISPTI